MGEMDGVARLFRRAAMGLEPFVKAAFMVEVAAWDLDPQPFQPLASLREGAEVLDRLGDAVSELDGGMRRRELEAELEALRTLLKILHGEEVPFVERVKRMEGCPAAAPTGAVVEALQGDLEEAAHAAGLRGDLAMAIPKWEAEDRVGASAVEALARASLEEARIRTAATIGLPVGEAVELRAVSGKPWSGFSDYRGDMKSLVQINLDLPWTLAGARSLMVHEAYPGHHTDAVWKTHHLRRRALEADRAVTFGGSPTGPISEGLADYGAVAIGWTGLVDFLSYRLSLYRSAVAVRACLGVWEEGWGRAEAIRHMMEEEFIPEARAAQAWDFITHPLYGPHTFCYYYGTRAVEEGHRRTVAVGAEAAFFHLLYSRPFTLAGFREAMRQRLGVAMGDG